MSQLAKLGINEAFTKTSNAQDSLSAVTENLIDIEQYLNESKEALPESEGVSLEELWSSVVRTKKLLAGMKKDLAQAKDWQVAVLSSQL